MSKSKQIGSVPLGFRTVTPYLVISGASKAIEFYKKAFNAKETSRNELPDGRILNAQIRIGDSIVMLSEEFPGSDAKSPTSLGTSTVTLHLYSKDAEKLWQQAISAGAKITMPMEDRFWGERYGQLTDPFGHRWSISKRVKMSAEEMETKRKAAMAMFQQGQHPGRPT
jgi:uncharacterized glyoxalase superfamily protein PhnB